jgi:predicted dehydrogenase
MKRASRFARPFTCPKCSGPMYRMGMNTNTNTHRRGVHRLRAQDARHREIPFEEAAFIMTELRTFVHAIERVTSDANWGNDPDGARANLRALSPRMMVLKEIIRGKKWEAK